MLLSSGQWRCIITPTYLTPSWQQLDVNEDICRADKIVSARRCSRCPEEHQNVNCCTHVLALAHVTIWSKSSVSLKMVVLPFSPTRNEVSPKQTHTRASYRSSLMSQTPQATALHGVLRGTHALVRMLRTFFFLFSSEKRYTYPHPSHER